MYVLLFNVFSLCIIYNDYGVFLFFKQKTAYEMRISDWSSDVCSSDLFKKCAACHTITPGGANGIGPNIHGIFGKPHGHLPTFQYSDALKSVPGAWDWDRDRKSTRLNSSH